MKALFCTCVLVISIYFIYWVQSFQSNAEDKSNDNFEQMNKISENYVVDNKNLKKFFGNEDAICKNGFKKYEDLIKATDNYVQRFVSLFLITSNLREYEIKDVNEMISIDLEISITGEDLIYLQGFSKGTKDSPFPKNFSKLDAIFSKIARLKERTYAENALKYSKSFFASFYNFSVLSDSNFNQFLFFLISLFMTWAIDHFLYHNSFYMFLVLSINCMIFWESLIVHQKKVKEADIEIFVHSLKGVPEECNPDNLRWYHSLLNYFSDNPCLQYYKNINKNAVTEVSLFKCIIDTYGYYLIQTPFRLFAASIRESTQEISALWPPLIRYFISIPYSLFFGILITFFILILCRKRLKLSFFGASVEIGDAQRITGSEKPAVTSCEIAKTTKVVKKLRPWTKSRFPKRLESNIGKHKKFFLRASRSESELPAEDELCIPDSYDEINTNKTTNGL